MDLGLSGKFALVTGGSHGIGLATAKRLASEGCHVAICSRSQQRLDAAMAELKSHGVKLLAVAADLLEAEAADRVMDVVDREWGGVQILVNNVGGGGRWGKEIVEDPDMRGWGARGWGGGARRAGAGAGPRGRAPPPPSASPGALCRTCAAPSGGGWSPS